MVFAIAMWTFDLSRIAVPGSFNHTNQFYFILGEKMRERSSTFLADAHGFLYYLMTGLHRLPPMRGDVFRGIDAKKAAAAKKSYTQGKRVHFSSFSSTSLKQEVATASFAGGNGLVLRITLLERDSRSRDISSLSVFGQEEAEVLLLPNFTAFVTDTRVVGGVEFIHLVEAASGTIVDIPTEP